ncbi:hypothetical protein COV18_03720 [Candidatus Woesearchaeota archaeon CG10_big_fil_rev_8_21_14_0_10_37_12]|nr:MAG: hypothetical protein COV18_03720 [Candidatus Woesearchaeota archaeon CG10_big_fil_rev_8_21_14_0_10_37_12]
MLLAHDIVEIESGDVCTYDKEAKAKQIAEEPRAFLRLKDKIPSQLGEEFHSLWLEYEQCQTLEAKFCKAIDALDPVIHNIFRPENSRKIGVTSQKIRDKKEKYFHDFPELLATLNTCLAYLDKNL